MKVLCVDTTTADLVVAIVHENKIEDFSVRGCGTRHSETLCNRVDFALKQSGLTFSDIDAFACCIGPGSFTGIRIGIATLKGYLFQSLFHPNNEFQNRSNFRQLPKQDKRVQRFRHQSIR